MISGAKMLRASSGVRYCAFVRITNRVAFSFSLVLMEGNWNRGGMKWSPVRILRSRAER